MSDANITCMMALGTHRYMRDEELGAKMGEAVLQRIRVIDLPGSGIM